MKKSTFPCLGYTLELISDDTHIISLNRIEEADLHIDESHQRFIQELKEYESHQRTRFDWPIIFNHTPFQIQVFKALQSIPCSEVRTYGEIAVMIGNPKASRAVGQAISNNPVLIVIPCHRVVSSTGLGGFSSGLDLKKTLLNHETRLL